MNENSSNGSSLTTHCNIVCDESRFVEQQDLPICEPTKKKIRNTNPLADNSTNLRYAKESSTKQCYLLKNNPALHSHSEQARISNVRSSNGKKKC
jgi:hypothetical protein